MRRDLRGDALSSKQMRWLLVLAAALVAVLASDTLVAEMHASWPHTPLLLEARCDRRAPATSHGAGTSIKSRQ